MDAVLVVALLLVTFDCVVVSVGGGIVVAVVLSSGPARVEAQMIRAMAVMITATVKTTPNAMAFFWSVVFTAQCRFLVHKQRSLEHFSKKHK